MSRLDDLLTTPMTRRQFLATLGLGVVSLFGFSSIIGLLSKSQPDHRTSGNGFGTGNFG